uniref:FBD domain-containing protein n=1 Tax=Chenopodium quinoa TaxID=63459 RepID=A0A803L0N1_CHEQI
MGSAVVVPKHYSIDCPNVKVLFVENVLLDHLKVINVSSACVCIIKKKIYFEDQDIRVMSVQHFELLLDKFRNAEFFQLGSKVYQQLKHCGHEYNEKLSGLSNKWTHITLRPGFRGGCLLGMFRLLCNSHMLEELIIYANGDFSCDCNELLVQEVISCYDLHRLKNVSIREYEKPYKSLFRLIEILLERADTLEKLVIANNGKDPLFSNDNQIFAMKLLGIPRASRNARVVFA